MLILIYPGPPAGVLIILGVAAGAGSPLINFFKLYASRHNNNATTCVIIENREQETERIIRVVNNSDNLR